MPEQVAEKLEVGLKTFPQRLKPHSFFGLSARLNRLLSDDFHANVEFFSNLFGHQALSWRDRIAQRVSPHRRSLDGALGQCIAKAEKELWTICGLRGDMPT